jgi:uncharacterized protein YggE
MSTKTITIPVPFVLSRARWVALGLAAGLVVAATASPAFTPRQILAADPASPSEHTISVAGAGRVILSPDTADLRLGVTATAKTVKDARAIAASAMTAVLASLRDLGTPTGTCRPRSCRSSPPYDYRPPAAAPHRLHQTLLWSRSATAKGDAIDCPAAGATSLTA